MSVLVIVTLELAQAKAMMKAHRGGTTSALTTKEASLAREGFAKIEKQIKREENRNAG